MMEGLECLKLSSYFSENQRGAPVLSFSVGGCIVNYPAHTEYSKVLSSDCSPNVYFLVMTLSLIYLGFIPYY